MVRNGWNHYRGLHIVVVNPSNGRVELAQVFDTHRTSQQLEAALLDAGIQDGSIVAAACQDDCVTQLSVKARSWFESMGS